MRSCNCREGQEHCHVRYNAVAQNRPETNDPGPCQSHLQHLSSTRPFRITQQEAIMLQSTFKYSIVIEWNAVCWAARRLPSTAISIQTCAANNLYHTPDLESGETDACFSTSKQGLRKAAVVTLARLYKQVKKQQVVPYRLHLQSKLACGTIKTSQE